MSRAALQHISKTFCSIRGEKVSALQDVTMEVWPKEILVLTGASGAGKSTLLRIIAGLEQPTSGTILFEGQVANDVPPDKRDLAMVFQQDALFPHLTIRDNLTLGLRLRKFAKAEIDSRVEQTAALLGIAEYLARFPKELSGGERQRVGLGRAIIRRPRLLLLDEPLVHLDTITRDKLRAEIVRLHRELEITMIYVTHDPAEALQMATRIATLDKGRLQRIELRGTG